MSKNEFINLRVHRNNDLSFSLHFKDYITGDSYNITGWTTEFTVQEKTFTTEIIEKIRVITTVHIDPLDGRTQIHVPNTLTDLVGVYQYEINFVNALGIRRTFAYGAITFLDD